MFKTWITLSTLLLIFTSSVVAQDKSWAIGLKGGGIIVSDILRSERPFTGENIRNENVLRYTGGVSVQYLVEKNFGLQVELNYTQRGWKQVYRAPNGGNIPDKFYEVSLDYAEVPILAHAYFGRKNLRLFINAGPYLAYLLNYDVNRANVTEEEITQVYDPRFRNDVDFGVRGGGGFEIVTAIGMFQAEGNVNWGINSILDKNLAEIPNIVQNLAVAITLGYYVQF